MSHSGKILVVDDETDTVDLIRLTLETADYQVEQAMDGATALRMIQSNSYDVLLLDIMMPDMSGFDVVQTLQGSDNKIPPVIFLTARTQAEDRQTGDDLGAAGYLTKPAKRGELLDAIEAAMKEE